MFIILMHIIFVIIPIKCESNCLLNQTSPSCKRPVIYYHQPVPNLYYNYNYSTTRRPVIYTNHLIANYYKPVNYYNYSTTRSPVTTRQPIHDLTPSSSNKYIQSRADKSRRPSIRLELKSRLRDNKLITTKRLRGIQLKTSGSNRRSDVIKKYANYIFIRVHPRTSEQLSTLLQLESAKELKLWNMPKIGQLVLLHLNPAFEGKVINTLKSIHLDHFVITQDLQTLIDSQIYSYKNRTLKSGFSYENYNTYQDIMTELSRMAKKHSRYVQFESIGKSYEGRDIPAIGLSFNGRFKRPAIMIECGIHSREWISPASCLWMINHLLTTQPKIVKNFDYHFIIIANPDGYEYTWTHDRLWRKNRRLTRNQAYHKRLNPSLTSCQGIDINRNFDVSFSNDGSTRLPCQDNYCGDAPFSELESLAIRNYVIKISKLKSIKVYIAVHSYSQMWMYPRGYSSLLPPNYHQLSKLAKAAAAGIYRTNGKVYKTGPISHVIYKAPGSSTDWVYEVGRVKLSFAVELRDEGEFGFLLPSDQIVDVSREFMNGLTSMIHVLKNERK